MLGTWLCNYSRQLCKLQKHVSISYDPPYWLVNKQHQIWSEDPFPPKCSQLVFFRINKDLLLTVIFISYNLHNNILIRIIKTKIWSYRLRRVHLKTFWNVLTFKPNLKMHQIKHQEWGFYPSRQIPIWLLSIPIEESIFFLNSEWKAENIFKKFGDLGLGDPRLDFRPRFF